MKLYCDSILRIAENENNYYIFDTKNNNEMIINDIAYSILKIIYNHESILIDSLIELLELEYSLNKTDIVICKEYINLLLENKIVKEKVNMKDNYIQDIDRVYECSEYNTDNIDNIEKINIIGKNAGITVKQNEDNCIRLELKYMRMYSDCIIEPKIINNCFEIDYKYTDFSDVEITVYLPKKSFSNINVQNINSFIILEKVVSDNITLFTTNGYINFSGQASTLDISTSNGLIDCTVEKLLDKNNNNINLNTSNGKVQVAFDIDEIGHIINVKNLTDKVNYFNSNMNLIELEESDFFDKSFKNIKYDDYKLKCLTNIKTSNGFVFFDNKNKN